MLSTQIKSCLFLLETDSFCSLTVALHTRICQPPVKIRITSLSLLSQGFRRFLFTERNRTGSKVRLAKVHLANQNTFPANFPKKAAKNHANLKGDSSKFNNSLFYRFICYQIRHI
jgi:hypothetical protein